MRLDVLSSRMMANGVTAVLLLSWRPPKAQVAGGWG